MPGNSSRTILPEGSTFSVAGRALKKGEEISGDRFHPDVVEKRDQARVFTFKVKKSDIALDKADLLLEGTLPGTRVLVNGHPAGVTEGGLRLFRYSIRDFLKKGKNEVTLLTKALTKQKQALVTANLLPSADIPSAAAYRMPVRDADGFLPVPDVRLRFHPDVFLRRLRVDQHHRPRSVLLSFHVDLESPRDCEVEFILSKNGQRLRKTRKHQVVLSSPVCWWPRGLGEQSFYDLVVKVYDGKKCVAEHETRIGLSQVAHEVVRLDGVWTNRFSINRRTFFTKGLALEIANDEEGERALTEAARLGCNMVRIKSRHGYISDHLLTLCDELGLLIWQDVPFEGLPARGDEIYLQEVRDEQGYHLQRYSEHPALAMWVGNARLEQESREVLLKNARTKNNYDRLFYTLLPEWCSSYGKGVPYLPSTPHHAEGYAYVRDDLSAAGDSHLLVKRGFPALARKTGFISEGATCSLPAQKEINEKGGNLLAGKQADLIYEDYLRPLLDKCLFPRGSGVLGWLSRLHQAAELEEAIITARLDFPARGGCILAQLHDTVEHGGGLREVTGQRKPAWYAVRNAFGKVICSGTFERIRKSGKDEGKLNIRIMSEDNLSKLMVSTSFFSVGGELLLQRQNRVQLAPGKVTQVSLQEGKYAEKIVGSLIRVFKNGELVAERLCWKDRQGLLSEIGEKPFLAMAENKANSTVLNVTGDRVFLYVHLSEKTGKGRFSENHFHLLPGENKTIRVSYEKVAKEARSLADYTIKSYFDAF